MRKEIATLHYLTQDLTYRSHEEQVCIACETGIEWIQLRVKNKPYDEWLAIARGVKKIVNQYNVTLIINDSMEIAQEIDADGVHLGQEDFSPLEARKILGEEKLIGFSTHSFDEIVAAKDFDVDYFGLGPFRFTSTKEKLNPVLGNEGIKSIIQNARELGITKPIIAIGGIQLEDIDKLFNSGVNGIALSSAINLANDPQKSIAQFQNQLETLNFKFQTQS